MRQKLLLLLIIIPVLSIGQRTKVAFLSNASTINDITELDTKAAGLYVQSFYATDFKYLNASTMVASDLNDVAALFFYYDNSGSFDLPGGNLSATNIADLTAYVQAGGSMLLAGFGTRIIDDLGRIPYEPGIAGNGGGGNNPDYWGFNNTAGMPSGNQATHPVYAGVAYTNASNGTGGTYDHDFVPLVDNGYKEDHNSMWDLGAISVLTQPHASVARGLEFQNLTNSVILGSWQQVTDMCCIAAIEFLPTGAYQGKIIAYGAAAYEWEMNDSRVNTYDNNVKLITTNALTYLKSFTQTLSAQGFFLKNNLIISPNPASDFISIQSRNEIKELNVVTMSDQKLTTKYGNGTLDIQNLTSGMYFIIVKDINNNIDTIKFIKK